MEVHSEIESRRKILAFRANDAPTVPAGFPGGSIRPATVTSTVDERDHLVSAPAASVGLAAGPGKSVALCGRLVLAAPLTVPPGRTCFDCETALHRVTVGDNASHRRYGLMARLLRRRRSRTGSRALSAGRHRVVRA